MKRVGVIALLAVGMFSTSAQAGATQTVQQLLERCNAERGSGSNLFCLGYVGGVADMMMTNRTIRKMDQLDGGAGRSYQICQTTAATYGADQQIFINWAQKHPERWQDGSLDGVASALRETWQCP
jgi:Rap1a immunity proteins